MNKPALLPLPATHPDWQRRWPAPAKLNLFLHVVGRRADGYHLLQTVFRFIERHDWLTFSPRQDGQICIANPLSGVPVESDLCYRAARSLQVASGTTHGITLHLDKHLPMGGGLGGGSSDAATVLLALNHLWQTGLSRPQLAEIGLKLGADVPVFIGGHNAFAEGVGEHLSPVELPPAWYLVLEPPAQVPTPAIFSATELKRDTPVLSLADWQVGMGINDLEAVACARFPAVAEALHTLRHVAPNAMMTGSGACLFATFANREAAEQAKAALPPALKAWIAKGLEQHPLADITSSTHLA